MTSDPLGIAISPSDGNLGVDMACILFKTFWHLNVVPLILEVDCEFANLVAEMVIILCELCDGDAVKDLTVVDGGDESIGNSTISVIEVLPCCEGIESHMG